MGAISSLFRNVSATLLVSLIIGCASYEPMKSGAPQEEALKEVVLTQDSITVHFFPYSDSILCVKYLGIKPGRAKMVPSLLKIENNSSRILKVNLEQCFFEISGEKCAPVPIEEALKRARRSGAEVVAWQIGFGVVGMSMAANNVTSTNRSLEEDFHSKYFKPTLINSGKTAQGILFNQYPSERVFQNCTFNLNVTDMTLQQELDIPIIVPDSILTVRRVK